MHVRRQGAAGPRSQGIEDSNTTTTTGRGLISHETGRKQSLVVYAPYRRTMEELQKK